MGFFSETNLKVLAGILAVVGGSLSFLGQHPRGYWVFIALAVVVFGLTFVPLLFSLGRRFVLLRSSKRYVIRQFPRLKRFYERFLVFTSESDTRGFRYQLYRASTTQNAAVSMVIGSDYIPSWLACYVQHLKTPPKSFPDFLMLCHEFTCIVTEFNRSYVIKIQKGLELTPIQQDMMRDHIVNELEQFRDEFVQYLRELEDWMNLVCGDAQKMMPNVFQHPQTVPIRIFERPGSFRGKKASDAP